MNMRRVVAFAAGLSLAFLTCGEAFAVKSLVELSPQDAEIAGFAIRALPANKDGTTTFVISRDLSKAESFDPGSDLTIRRTATLRVYGDAGLVIQCCLEPEAEKNVLTYRVVLAQGVLARTHLSIEEVDDYKNREGRSLHRIGGGTIYEIALDKFKAK